VGGVPAQHEAAREIGLKDPLVLPNLEFHDLDVAAFQLDFVDAR
jgi:hypothetical protein